MTYEEIKTWVRENKQKFVLAACFALVFMVGFGTGRFNKENEKKRNASPSNYNTNKAKSPETGGVGDTANPVTTEAVKPEVLGQSKDANCPVKGNISSKGSKIYHIQGGAFYDITKPEQCFQTEAAAQAAGFKKSSR